MEFSERLLERLRVAYTVAAVTGAGISAASGIPTFRGKEGLWRKYKPEELANFAAFQKNPQLVWEWYAWRRKIVQKAQPNLGHYALVDMERLFPEFILITQNVDNLHQRAGSKHIIELHGNITRSKCSRCGKPYQPEVNPEQGIPACPECGGLIRPDVVWFGETLPEAAISRAQEAAMQSEVFFSIGTSAVVEPAASLPYIARGNGAYVVEINPDKTPLTDVADEHLNGPADKILPALIIALERLK